MEPGIAAAAYAVESAVEGVGVALAIAKPTMPLKASFQKIPASNALPRSSHTLSIVKGKAYIFGGEIKPREPVDNDVHIYTLPASSVAGADYQCVPARSKTTQGETPLPRVGHTAAVIDDRIYVFGGRGGPDMKPLEEHGRVWCFDTIAHSWSPIDPIKGSPYPEARSYHASAANSHPLPSPQDHTVDPVGSPDPEAHGTVYIHGGCPASGRVADAWAFDVAARSWSQLPDAPWPARGGPCLAFAQNRLYRFGGFDGTREVGGQIDYLEMAKSTFDDQGGKGELAVFPRTGRWATISFPDGADGPGNRSVAGLHPVTTGQGRNFLLLLLGEKDPSSNGHEAAGKFWSDVWSYQLRPEGMTAASVKDATRGLFGAETGEGTWAQVDVAEPSSAGGSKEHPGERGWFGSAVLDTDAGGVVLWGGIDGKNERLGDGWILKVDL